MIRWKIAQWLENIWWRKYLKDKHPKEYIIWKRNYWQGFLKKIKFPYDKIESPCIDIGCGPAGIFTILEDKKVTALDPLLKKYQENLAIFSFEKYPQVNFKNIDFESYKNEQKFKTIFCLNAINHFKDLNFSLKKINQLMDMDGKLIMSIDAHNFSFFKHLFRLIPLDALHPHQFDLEEYKDLLVNAGFEILNITKTEKHFFFDYWVLEARKK